jgi:hypothetical protein
MVVFCNLFKKKFIFAKVNDFYFVTEFQNRRSEHDHGLLWIKDAPIYGVDSIETIEQFVNKYVTLNISILRSHLQDSQMHKHQQTYRKKHQAIYRFHYPLTPMPYTKILKPLKKIIISSKIKKIVKHCK